MGGGENQITIKSVLDTVGFEKGSQRLKKAVDGLGKSVQSIGRAAKQYTASASQSFGSAAGVIKRIIPMILGVGSAYQVISRAVSAFMSQNQELASKMNSIWTALGNILGPILTQIISWITMAVSYFIEFLRLLGITTKKASEASKAAGGAGGALQKTIAGFDELQKLSEGGGGGGGGAGLDDPKKLPEWMEMLAEALRAKMWDDAADIIIGKFNDLIHVFAKNAEKFGKKCSEYLAGALRIIGRVFDETDWNDLGRGIARFFNGLFSKVDGTDIGKILVGKFTIAFKILTGFFEELDYVQLAKILSDVFIGAMESLAKTIESADFSKIGEGIRTFFANIDWAGIGTSLFKFLKVAWDGALELFKGLLTSDGEDLPLLSSLQKLLDAIEKFANSISQNWSEKIQPVLDWTVNEALPKFFEALADTIQDLADLLNGDMNFGEFITHMNGLEKALAALFAIKIGSWGLDIAEGIGKIISVFGGGAGAAGTAAAGGGIVNTIRDFWAALSLGAEAVGGVATIAPIAVGGLAMLGTVMLDNKLSADYLAEGLNGAGNSTADLAAKINEWNEMASHQDDILWESMAGIDSYGYSLQEARYAAEAAANALPVLAEMLGLTTEELKKQIEAAGGDVTQIEALQAASSGLASSNTDVANSQQAATAAIDEYGNHIDGAANKAKDASDKFVAANSEMSGSAQDTASQADVSYGEVESAVSDKLGNAATSGASSTAELEENVTSDFQSMEDAATSSMENVEKALTDGVKRAAQTVKLGLDDLLRSVRSACSNMSTVVTSSTSGIAGALNSYWASMSHNAYVWGADMMILMNNGIVAAFNSYLHPTLSQVAQMIKNYLGFSKPKMGPLSDADTYMPDFMELMASGLKDNIPMAANAAAKVAEAVSEEIQNEDFSLGVSANDGGIESAMDVFSDKIISGFSEMIEKLQSIAENVAFTMPAVAGGGVLPYSVAVSGVDETSSSNETEVLEAVRELRELIQEFMNAVENMQWVAQFGDMRAIVRQITQMQKQMERSKG